jgi:hypothetical protein
MHGMGIHGMGIHDVGIVRLGLRSMSMYCVIIDSVEMPGVAAHKTQIN